MFFGTVEQNPIGHKVRGTNLYRIDYTSDGDYSGCRQCGLAIGRRHVVIGNDGRRIYDQGYSPKLVFIGVAPRGTEDVSGVGFLGQEGRILKAIFKLVPHNFNYYLTYLVGCRTKDIVYNGEFLDEELAEYEGEVEIYDEDRKPFKREIEACRPHLDDIMIDYNPVGVVYLGKFTKAFKTKKPSVLLESLEFITTLEYKLLTVRKQAAILSDFICSLKSKVSGQTQKS